MVFYRKYRSQTINDLDSTAVRQTLLSILQKPESIPHAFLFTGPKGLGKTSTARIVAKVINCTGRAINQEPRTKNQEQQGKVLSSQSSVQSMDAVASIEPCNQCDQCISITNGTNLDVFEIDAASNRGIDEIRDLKEKIRLSPVAANKKVYIIDEVHMLTSEAFNALLKTLEEPPEHAVFMLCTTEAYKVPETIMSRCFRIAFKRATDEEIVRSLNRIVSGEGLQADQEALLEVAKIADGGFRDAAKMLEEFAMLAQGQQITKDLFKKSFKTTTLSVQITNLLDALKKYDTKASLEVVTELLSEGVDIKYFLQQTIEELHTMLLISLGIKEQESKIKGIELDLEEIKKMIGLFSKASSEMKYAVLPQLPLELAIIEWTQMNKKPHPIRPELTVEGPDPLLKGEGTLPVNPSASSPLMGEDRGEGKKLESLVQRPGPSSVGDLRKQVGAMKKLQALYGETKVADAVPTVKIIGEHPVDLMHTFPDGEITKEWLHALWTSIIIEMKLYNHTIAGVLRGCMIKSYDKKTLVIETAYTFHKERLDDTKTKAALYKVCKLLTGNEVEVTIELKK